MIVTSLILFLFAIALFQITKVIADEVEKLVLTAIAVVSFGASFVILVWPLKLMALTGLGLIPLCVGFQHFGIQNPPDFHCPGVCFWRSYCSRSDSKFKTHSS